MLLSFEAIELLSLIQSETVRDFCRFDCGTDCGDSSQKVWSSLKSIRPSESMPTFEMSVSATTDREFGTSVVVVGFLLDIEINL